MAEATDRALQQEAHEINYGLRVSFFYRKLREDGFFGFVSDIEKLAKSHGLYSWEDRLHWRITHDAWRTLQDAKIEPLKILAHPKVLMEHTKLVGYYRNVAVFPRKGLQYLAFDITKYELGKKRDMTYQQALQLAKLFNSHISAILESTSNIKYEEIKGLMFSSAGASLDGSWRNRVGKEAETRVKSYLVRRVLEKKLIAATIDAEGSPADFEPAKDYVLHVDSYLGFKLKNGWTIRFSSEPDISFIDQAGVPQCAIEVKGGADPAGALERLGAVQKSFRSARKDNASVRTVLVASCITAEMARRLEDDPLVDEVFNLTAIIGDLEERERFLQTFEPHLEMC